MSARAARLGSPAQEVADVLTHKGYKVIVQDYDIPFTPNSYQDLAGIDDPEERKRRIIAAAEGQSQGFKAPQQPILLACWPESRMSPGAPMCSQPLAMVADGKQNFHEFRCTPPDR